MIFQTSLVRVLRGVKAGVDPGFFLGGGAPLSKLVASTLSHVFFLFFFFSEYYCTYFRKLQLILVFSGEWGECAHPALLP